MSTTETESPIVQAVREAGDGTELRDSVEAITELLAEVGRFAKDSLSGLRASTTRNKKLCVARLKLAASIVKPNGFPDWSASTQAYRNLLAIAETGVWDNATGDEKRRIDTAVRVAKTRTFLEPFITQYVLDTTPNVLTDEERASLKWDEKEEGYPFLRGNRESGIPPKLADAIAEQYSRSDIEVPQKFGGRKPTDAPGPGPDAQKNPVATLEAAMGGLENVSSDVQIASVLRLLSAMFAKVRTPEARYGEKGPEAFAAMCHRVAVLADTTGKVAVGAAKDPEIAKAEQAVWTKDDLS